MDKYKIIVKALEDLKRLTYINTQCSVKFGIKSLNETHFYDPSLFPTIMVCAKTDQDGLILEDLTLSISLFLDTDHKKESKELFDKLKKSKFKEYFYDFPENFNFRPLHANVGNDINIVAGLVIQIIYFISKCRDFDITPEFTSYLGLEQRESLDSWKVNPAEVSIAVKKAFETGLPLIAFTSICMDILRERIEGYDFLGEVIINKEYEDNEGYRAFITTTPFINRPLDSIIKNLKKHYVTNYIEACNLLYNSFELTITFRKNQEEAFLQLITEIFKIFYPSLQTSTIATQLNYNNFISKPSVSLQYFFHSDGTGPSEIELKNGRQLIDNFEVEVDEDDYYDPGKG